MRFLDLIGKSFLGICSNLWDFWAWSARGSLIAGWSWTRWLHQKLHRRLLKSTWVGILCFQGNMWLKTSQSFRICKLWIWDGVRVFRNNQNKKLLSWCLTWNLIFKICWNLNCELINFFWINFLILFPWKMFLKKKSILKIIFHEAILNKCYTNT